MSFINLLVRNDDGREALSQVPPGSYVIGRELTCDVVIASQGVSRRHAMIHVSEDAVTVEDLGSSQAPSSTEKWYPVRSPELSPY